MSKQINIKYEGKDYTLMFTKKTFEDAINKGISFSNVSENPLMLIKVFWMALMAKHENEKITLTQATRMYDAQNPKSKLLTALATIWNDVPNGLIEDDAEGETTWGANFEIEEDEPTSQDKD